jgi:hypothetical protein
MLRQFFNQLFSKQIPIGFRFLNLAILLPTLLWPFVFFTSIFFFDNPKNLGLTYLLFLAVNAYPIYLLIIAYFNSKLFLKNRALGSILPITILLTFTIGGSYTVFSVRQDMSKRREEFDKRDRERKAQGFIGVNDDYKIVGNKVFRYDTLIEGADAETFELASWGWQRDKNYYYRFGKRISTIDRQTFEDLGYHYGKDKNHVYYDEKIIEGADAKTFYHIEGTQDGKDQHNCYRWGKKVDCKVLETVE